MIWVPLSVVIVFHDRQISRHGGAPGMRDQSLLEAACARPVNRFQYGETSVAVLAAAYAYGIAKAHAFVDGNKRTAFVTSATFLRLNGYHLRPDPIEGERVMNDLASGEVSETAFVEWLNEVSKYLTMNEPM